MRLEHSAVLLAGGRSRRMGEPKALLDLGGTPLLAHVGRALLEACDELILSVAPDSEAPPGFVDSCLTALRRVGASELQVVRDRELDRGPAAGLARALAAARGELAFVSGCDSPFLSAPLVRGLLARAQGVDAPEAVIPVYAGRAEPLLAVYRARPMALHFAEQLTSDSLALTAGLESRKVVHVAESNLLEFDPLGASFLNVNTPADYQRALEARQRLAKGVCPAEKP